MFHGVVVVGQLREIPGVAACACASPAAHTHSPLSPISWSLDRLLSRSRLTSYITACVAWFKNAGVEERPPWSRVGSSDEVRPGLEV